MKLKIDNQMFEKIPDFQLGVLLVENIKNDKDNKEIQSLLKKATEEIRSKYSGLDVKSVDALKTFFELYEKNGWSTRNFPPSVIALYKRVLSGSDLPSINPLVDLYNAFSIKEAVAVGGHDLEFINDDVVLRFSKEGDQFRPMFKPEEIEKIPAGEPTLTTGDDVLTRFWCFRQGDISKIRPETKSVMIFFDTVDGREKSDIQRIMDEFKKEISKFGEVKAEQILDRNNSEMNLESSGFTTEANTPKINSMKVDTDPKKIDEVLSRFVDDVVVKEDLKKEMMSGRPLKIYLGTDVTGADLHLGHAAIHRKLRDFQDLGHEVTLLIGNFTTLVGDHSDKLDQRKETSSEEVERLEKTYFDQFGKTVDMSKVKVVHNADWLSKLNFNDVIQLAKVFTVQQNIERDAFQKRIAAKSPIGLDEFLYPLMQGYDAYALRTDIQIGGTDQTFNLHAGRKIMEYFKVKPQNYIAMKLLVGNDGRKMGKSLMNFIPILAKPNEMYGQLMSISDEVMENYFVALTRIPLDEINEMMEQVKSGKVNPIEVKKKLAFDITKFYSSEKDAIDAEKHFASTVQNKELPADMPEFKISDLSSREINIVDLLDETNLVSSRGEAKRLVAQGGVEVNGEKITNTNESVDLIDETIVRAGKRNYIKLRD